MANSPLSVTATARDHSLPPELHHVEEAIRGSRWILEIEPDEDAGVTEPYSEAILDRAADFLRRHALWIWKNHGVIIEAPRLEPGLSGSIDIHWDSPEHELLVNIPRDPAARGGFYGDDRGSRFIKGTLDPAALSERLLAWFTNNRSEGTSATTNACSRRHDGHSA
jgi:hypothetical protein